MRRGSIISRFAGAGVAAALAALLLWPFIGGSDVLVWPFLALLVVAGLCGLGVLVLTGADILLHPRRGARVGPIRVFDIVSGAALLVFAVVQLHWLSGRLPA